MQIFWRKIGPYWHIMTGLFVMIVSSILWVNNVTGYDGRIIMLETVQNKQQKQLTRMDYNVQLIGRAIGVKPLVKEDDE